MKRRIEEAITDFKQEIRGLLRSIMTGAGSSLDAQSDVSPFIKELVSKTAILGQKADYPNQKRFEEQVKAVFSDTANYYLFEFLLSRAFLAFAEDQAAAPFITEENLPDDLAQGYFDENHGNNLITLAPEKNLWIQENRDEFYAALDQVTGKATGMIMAADQMTNIARKDGVRAAVAAISVIFILLLIDFRNLKLTLLTMLPLVVSLFALLGFMRLTDIRFDFINIIAIPLLIGIGIDDAIHISHRYRLEGPGAIALTVEKIGRAILLTTLTTMIGFASFIPSAMRAMRSTGVVLTIAMFMAFLFSIFMHASILVLVREKIGGSFSRWGKKIPERDQAK